MEAALAVGKFVLADRYIGSNMAHQSARTPSGGREEFLEWLKRLEYGVYGLPARRPGHLSRACRLQEARRLVGLKSAACTYTTLQRDIQEADTKHLEQTAIIYERLATEANWVSIDCINPAFRRVVFARPRSAGRCFGPWNSEDPALGVGGAAVEEAFTPWPRRCSVCPFPAGWAWQVATLRRGVIVGSQNF